MKSNLEGFLSSVGFMALAILAFAFGSWRGQKPDSYENMLFGVIGGLILVLIYFLGMAMQVILKKILG